MSLCRAPCRPSRCCPPVPPACPSADDPLAQYTAEFHAKKAEQDRLRAQIMALRKLKAPEEGEPTAVSAGELAKKLPLCASIWGSVESPWLGAGGSWLRSAEPDARCLVSRLCCTRQRRRSRGSTDQLQQGRGGQAGGEGGGAAVPPPPQGVAARSSSGNEGGDSAPIVRLERLLKGGGQRHRLRRR